VEKKKKKKKKKTPRVCGETENPGDTKGMTKKEVLRLEWDAAMDLLDDEFGKLQKRGSKSEQEKIDLEKTRCCREFPQPYYTEEEQFDIYCLRKDDRTKQLLNRIKYMKNHKTVEQLQDLLNGGPHLSAGAEFHKSEPLMYQHYLELLRLVGLLSPLDYDFKLHSEEFLDLKIRQQVDKKITQLTTVAKWRDRKRKKRKAPTSTPDSGSDADDKGEESAPDVGEEAKATEVTKDLPNVQKLVESISHCCQNYDGSVWKRYCSECGVHDCAHSKNKNHWRWRKDVNGKRQKVYDYVRVPSNHHHLVRPVPEEPDPVDSDVEE
jgi:hypothetical protein